MKSQILLKLFLIVKLVLCKIELKNMIFENLAAKCITNYVKIRMGEGLTTILAQDNLEDIQNTVLKSLHLLELNSFVNSNGSSNEFISTKICVNCPTNSTKIFKYNFVTNRKSNNNIIIINEVKKLKDIIEKFSETRRFNVRGHYLIYFHQVAQSNIKYELLDLATKEALYKSYILVPDSQTKMSLYTYDFYAEDAAICFASPDLRLLNRCVNGDFVSSRFIIRSGFENLNCSLPTVLLISPPFVINMNEGLEIKLLQQIGIRLNISYDFTLDKRYEYWGRRIGKETYDGLLREVQDNNTMNIGVGAFALNEERSEDFDFTVDYFSEQFVWVIPIPTKLPQWKVILVIFPFYLWIALMFSFIIFSVLIYFLSRNNKNELKIFARLGDSAILCFQIMICLAVANQPRTLMVRSVFACLVLFSLIIVICYQSALIDVLTNPIYEDGLSSEDKILSSNLHIGGISTHKPVFNDSENSRASLLYNIYKVNNENDTMRFWLDQVSTYRNAATILGRNYIDFLLGINSPLVVQKDLTPKIIYVNDFIYVSPIRIVCSKGFPLLNSINTILSDLTHNGLVSKWISDYLKGFNKQDFDDFEEFQMEMDDDKVIVITLKHMEGTFAMLILGNSSGILIFFTEMIIFKIEKQRKKMLALKVIYSLKGNKRNKNVENWKRVTKKILSIPPIKRNEITTIYLGTNLYRRYNKDNFKS